MRMRPRKRSPGSSLPRGVTWHVNNCVFDAHVWVSHTFEPRRSGSATKTELHQLGPFRRGLQVFVGGYSTIREATLAVALARAVVLGEPAPPGLEATAAEMRARDQPPRVAASLVREFLKSYEDDTANSDDDFLCLCDNDDTSASASGSAARCCCCCGGGGASAAAFTEPLDFEPPESPDAALCAVMSSVEWPPRMFADALDL